jgi:hypothetical protein
MLSKAVKQLSGLFYYDEQLEISAPSSMRHEGHIGLNSTGSFEMKLPSEWLEQNPAWKQVSDLSIVSNMVTTSL